MVEVQGFGDRLAASVAKRGPLCAGIDPHAELLDQWGLPDTVVGLERFARTCAEALGPVCAVVKPQSAFFERFGSAGVAVLEQTIADCREQGALVLTDVKRGDIGSTSAAYASAYLDPASSLAADAITASPYLGVGALEAMFSTALEHGAGVFVLALTSNLEGASVQRAIGPDGTVAAHVLGQLARRNRAAYAVHASEHGPFGAVIGATVEPGGFDFDFGGPILAPGFGAQGGTVADLRRLFGPDLDRVLPSSSREILRHGPDVAALRAAAVASNDALRADFQTER